MKFGLAINFGWVDLNFKKLDMKLACECWLAWLILRWQMRSIILLVLGLSFKNLLHLNHLFCFFSEVQECMLMLLLNIVRHLNFVIICFKAIVITFKSLLVRKNCLIWHICLYFNHLSPDLYLIISNFNYQFQIMNLLMNVIVT